MTPAHKQRSGALAPSISLSGLHNGVDGDANEISLLQRRVHELEAKAHKDAARLAELDKVLEHYDALAHRLRLLHGVAGILARAITIEEALPLVLKAIGETRQWDIAIAWVLEGGAWTQRHVWCDEGLDASLFLVERRQWRFESDQGLPGRAVKEGKLVWVDDFSSDPGFPCAQAAGGGKWGNALAFPLKCGRAIYGVIQLIRRASGSLPAGVQELFDALRSDIGRFIEARFYEKRWETIFENSPLPTCVTDIETGECLTANHEMLEWLGLPEEDVVGRTLVELKIWSSTCSREEIVYRVQERGYLRNFEILAQAQATPRNVLINMECVKLYGRSCFLVQLIDITARKRLEATLRLTATAVEHAAEAMVILDGDGTCLTVNPAFTRITGYHSVEAVGQTLDVLLHRPTGRHGERFYRIVTGQLALSGHWEGEVWAKRKNDEVFPTLLSVSVIRNEGGMVVNHVAVFNDVSNQKAYEERLKKLALHDGLTGLPNRSLLMEHLGQALLRAKRNTAQVAVFFADLDRFKSVNDLFGHDVGDDLLRQVALRFRQSVRASDLVARLGGDEFVVVLGEEPSRTDSTRIAQKIVAAMARPFIVQNRLLEVSVSIGIALYPEHADDARLLLKRADEALYRVKRTERDGYGFFERTV